MERCAPIQIAFPAPTSVDLPREIEGGYVAVRNEPRVPRLRKFRKCIRIGPPRPCQVVRDPACKKNPSTTTKTIVNHSRAPPDAPDAQDKSVLDTLSPRWLFP